MRHPDAPSPGQDGREVWLKILLRIGGVLTLTAVFAVFLPVEWMAEWNDRLGLGSFPEVPLVDYLTRSVSALYAFHGGLLLVLASDPRRHRPLVVYAGWATLVLGILLLGIDLHAGMPLWWTLNEGPWVVLMGLLLLWLVRGVPRKPA